MDWIRVEGHSMRPFLAQGDWIGVEWLTETNTGQLQPGQIVLGMSSDRDWIVHRVVKADSGKIEIKGDMAPSLDGMSTSHLWGEVRAVRKQNARAEIKFHLNDLDRWIASLSAKLALSDAAHWSAKGIRQMIRVLGLLRRILL